MSVERLPSGGWRARWRDASGKEHSKGSKRWRKREAEAFERKMIEEREHGAMATAGSMTVNELADNWLSASRHLAESSKKTYRWDLDRHILPVLGELRVAKVSGLDIDNYLAGLTVAASSQRRHLQSILSPMFTYARKRGLITVSPTADVKAPRYVEAEKRFLSVAELRQLSSAFPDRWQAMIIFTGIMGTRLGETLNMRPDDIRDNVAMVRGTKSRASRRRVTMPQFVRGLVAYQLAYYSTPDALWPTTRGGPPDASSWRDNVWSTSLARSGIGHLRYHDLRHTAAALMIRSGANPLLVQRRLGHSSISVTLGTYGHLFPEADQDVADGLDDLW